MKFELTGVEYSIFKLWDTEHKKVCPLLQSAEKSAIGGRLKFSFTPTGLGSSISVKCVCGEEVDCTCYGSW